jgi:hypothetical protein
VNSLHLPTIRLVFWREPQDESDGVTGTKKEKRKMPHLKNAAIIFAIALVAIWASNRFAVIKNITG